MGQPPDFNAPIETGLTGIDLMNKPMLNKGTAFTDAERDVFHLHGLLPPQVGTLDQQVARRLKVLRAFATDFERYAFLRELQDSNETLFHALTVRNLEEILPLVYTPTVGEGCQRFSEIWRKPRGLFLSYPNKDRIREILSAPRLDGIRIIVVSDGERILGLGDQGAGGMGIPIGKLALYTACAGIHPDETLPILLDVGTSNQERLTDPLYVGWRHERMRGDDYDGFIEEFISAVAERWPDVLLQWEDFAGSNASRLLGRYRDRLCSFNDDIQGTAAIATGTLLAAVKVTGIPLAEQRIAILGAGSAGCGIAALLLQAMIDAGAGEAEARRRFFLIDRNGLLCQGMAGVTPAQTPFLQTQARTESILRSLALVPRAILVVPDEFTGEYVRHGLSEIGNQIAVDVQKAPMSQLDRAAKRAMDIALSSLLIVFFSPLFLAVTLAIIGDSSGPVLFRQLRNGYQGRSFRILKFRTMTVMEDGEEAANQACKDDLRVTRVGRILRKFSLDELPQLFNVLRGEMSLIGPRPHPRALDAFYSKLIENYEIRQHVKPGITGWAQVHGLRGETQTLDLMYRRIEFDCWYAKNCSVLLDLRILARTVLEVLRPRNAY